MFRTIWEHAKMIVIAGVLAILFRSFLYEPYHIPSSSMEPTLLVGDYLFVEKFAYGYTDYSFPFSPSIIGERRWFESTPARGDVIVFRLPSDTDTNYIKRVVGLPGDRIAVKQGRLYINDQVVKRELKNRDILSTYVETLPDDDNTHLIYEFADNAPLDNTEAVIVPARHIFVMGDNRDNSKDSRVMGDVGFIPFKNIVGRAALIFFSTETGAPLWRPDQMVGNWRLARFFNSIR